MNNKNQCSCSCLHKSRAKGVKVELGIPHDLWHVPSAGVTELQRHVSIQSIMFMCKHVFMLKV